MAIPLLHRESPARCTTVQCESIPNEPIDELLTTEIYKQIFMNGSEQHQIRLELQITFKNQATRIKATSYKLDRQNNTIECLFDASIEQAALFAYNETSVPANVSICATSYRKEATTIGRFESFILTTPDSEYTVESKSKDDVFFAKLEPLTHEQKRSVVIHNRCSNASDSGDSSAQNSPEVKDRMKNIFALTRAKLVHSY